MKLTNGNDKVERLSVKFMVFNKLVPDTFFHHTNTVNRRRHLHQPPPRASPATTETTGSRPHHTDSRVQSIIFTVSHSENEHMKTEKLFVLFYFRFHIRV